MRGKTATVEVFASHVRVTVTGLSSRDGWRLLHGTSFFQLKASDASVWMCIKSWLWRSPDIYKTFNWWPKKEQLNAHSNRISLFPRYTFRRSNFARTASDSQGNGRGGTGICQCIVKIEVTVADLRSMSTTRVLVLLFNKFRDSQKPLKNSKPALDKSHHWNAWSISFNPGRP